mmetsp:Transcript_19666/g.43001  ORF Transcript_19666/g.43001 Transcript_19666/m.43001 type:complete len:184 (+) Transcript_19666:184-735(+)
MKLAQEVVVFCHSPFALEDLDQHSRLIVCIGREGLALLCRDSRIALNEFRHHTPCRLQAHGQGRHVQQQQVLYLRRAFARQDSCLNCGSKGDCLIGVDGFAWLLPIKELLDHRLHFRDTRGTSDQHHLVHISLINAAVTQALLHWTHRVPEVIHAKLLKASTRQGTREVDAFEKGVDLNRCLG